MTILPESPAGRPAAAPPAWQRELARAYTDPGALLAALGLAHLESRLASPDVLARFPLRVPRGFVARMGHGDAADPLLRQVLPLDAEGRVVPGFTDDPVGDLASRAGPGLLHKYAGRVLVITTGACAVHCRYCFRREFPYAQERAAGAAEVAAALAGVERPTEVILSGGDPLVLSDRRLAELLALLDADPRVRRVRIHTRVPVVLPERVDAGLEAVLAGFGKALVVVLHANHANEIDAAVTRAAGSLARVTRTLLNQAVLLRGVNDSAAALIALSERLFEAGILPYYLHQLDSVSGAAHFAVDDDSATALVTDAARSLPGYLVPRLVREIAGAPFKVPVRDARPPGT